MFGSRRRFLKVLGGLSAGLGLGLPGVARAGHRKGCGVVCCPTPTLQCGPLAFGGAYSGDTYGGVTINYPPSGQTPMPQVPGGGFFAAWGTRDAGASVDWANAKVVNADNTSLTYPGTLLTNASDAQWVLMFKTVPPSFGSTPTIRYELDIPYTLGGLKYTTAAQYFYVVT